MTPTALLKKIYRRTNSVWDASAGQSRFELPGGLTDAQHVLLTEADLLPNSFERLSHDSGLSTFTDLHDHPNFTLSHATRLFLDALGGGPLVGLSAILIHLHTRVLTLHEFAGPHAHACEVCGFPPDWTHDRTQEIYSAMLGHSGNELIHRHLPVLHRHLSMTPGDTARGEHVLASLLQVIGDAPEAETPSKLQTRVARAKLLPVRDKYAQHGILQTLADFGILPQSAMPPAMDAVIPRAQLWEISRTLPGSSRSDIPLPLAAWRGVHGVDHSRAAALLAHVR